MNEILGGVKQAFWNPEEKRLRALFRVPSALAVGLLCLFIVVGIVNLVSSLPFISTTNATLFVQGVGVVVVVALTWFIDRRHLRDFGLSLDKRWRRDLLAGIVAGTVMIVTVVATLLLSGMGNVMMTELSASMTPLIQAFLFFAGVAVLEELIIRGYLLVNIAEGLKGLTNERTATLIAVLITAVVFALGHGTGERPLVTTLTLSTAGVLLGMAYVWTNRLGFPVGLHFAWNFLLGPILGFSVSGQREAVTVFTSETSGPTLVTGGDFGPEGGVVMFLALIVGTAVLGWWTRHQYGTLAVNERIAVPDLWVDGDGDS